GAICVLFIKYNCRRRNIKMALTIQNKKEITMNRTLKWIVWFFILMPAIYLAIVWNTLPEKLALHFDLQGNPDRYGSKIELVFVTALLIVVASLTFKYLPLAYKIDPRKTAVENKSRLQVLGLAIAVFISFISFVVIRTAASGNIRLNIAFVFSSIGIM